MGGKRICLGAFHVITFFTDDCDNCFVVGVMAEAFLRVYKARYKQIISLLVSPD